MLCAVINNNTVISVEEIADADIAERSSHCQQIIDVSNSIPTPDIGWAFNGSTLSPPPSSTAAPTMKITKLALQNRFTDAENIAILMYVSDATKPYRFAVQMVINKLGLATYIDLNRADTRAGVHLLVVAGILTSDRETAILTTVPTAIEIYRG